MSKTTHVTIRIESETDGSGDIEVARIFFSNHYVVEVRKDGRDVSFALVATHHGFKADATLPGGELENILEEVRRTRPEAVIDSIDPI